MAKKPVKKVAKKMPAKVKPKTPPPKAAKPTKLSPATKAKAGKATRAKRGEAPACVMISVDELFPSPSNPRKRFDESALEELAANIREHGVIEPVLVRPRLGRGYEIVAGERRTRASKIARLTQIPCIVRELDDQRTLELQISENLHRNDMTVLETADAFAALRDKHGCSVSEIAAHIGCAPKLVHQRLRVAKLAPGLREVLEAGTIKLGSALLIGGFPVEDQEKIAKKIASESCSAWRTSKTLSHAEVQNLTHQYSRRLKLATFPIDDKSLVREAGACVGCAKNTDTQLSLIDDVSQEATCLDRTCWDGKTEAMWARQRAEAERAGMRIVEGKDAASVARADDVAWELVDDEDEDEDFDAERNDAEGGDVAATATPPRAPDPTWADLVPKAERVLVRDSTGRVFEGVTPEARARVLEAAGKKLDDSPGDSRNRNDDFRRERAVRTVTMARAMADIVAVAETPSTHDATIWSIVALALSDSDGTSEAAAKRRGWMTDDDDTSDAGRLVRAKLEELSPTEVRGLALELAFDTYHPEESAWEQACALAGFDYAEQLEVARAEVLAAESNPPEAKASAKKSKKTADVPAEVA